jgi:hypothetical protein
MADTQQRGAAPAGATTTTEREIPSFTKTVNDRVEARTKEIADSAGLPADRATTTERQPSTTTEKPAGLPADRESEMATVEEFTQSWNAMPVPLRARYAQAFYDDFNKSIGEQYGDLIPLVIQARENPQLRAALVEMADPTKEELRAMIADPELRKHAKSLTKAEIREFLLGEALTTYNRYATPATEEQPQPGAPTAAERRVEALEQRFEEQDLGRETQAYIASAGQEVRALKNAFPNLTDEQLTHVVQVTQERFETAAARAGIDTKNPNWPARALKAGIKPSQLREYAAQYSEILGRQAPPAAPATTSAKDPAPPQAPRDPVEARNAGIRALREVRAKNPALQGRSPRR